ncbi:MAG: hemolysin family protein [Dehalococcoidia bacterium]
MLETGGGLLAILALVLANGFFVMAEFALVTVRRTRVEQLVDEGRAGARSVAEAIEHLDSYIAACQLGITVASLALGWIGEPVLAGLLDPVFGGIGAHAASVTVAFVIITALHVIAGELAPKGIALQYSERAALAVAGPLRLFRAVFRPVIWVLNESGWLVVRVFGVSPDVGESRHLGRAELLLAVEASTEAGELKSEDQFLIERALRFRDLTAAQVMVPRTELLALPVETTVAEARRFVAESHHSRYPVYRDSIDNVIGVIHVRDLILAANDQMIEPLLRQPLLVPAQASVNDVLAQMRDTRTHFAIAVDEYGGTDGIIALEDLLEELVGELQDEFEEGAPAHEDGPGDAIRIGGLDNVDVLGELLGVEVGEGPYKTVAGYIVDRVGSIPGVGDHIDVDGYRLTVVEMDALRVATVEATPLPVPSSRESTAG